MTAWISDKGVRDLEHAFRGIKDAKLSSIKKRGEGLCH